MALIMALTSAVSAVVFRYLTVTDVAMLYLLGTGVVASRYGRGPSLAAAILGIAAFDFFFVPPYFTFAVSDLRYVLTFGVMLGIAVVISGLTHRIREQAETARQRERRTAAVYAMSRELAAARGRDQLIEIATRHLRGSFGVEALVLLDDGTGRMRVAGAHAATIPIDEKERSVAQWVFERKQRAGIGTDTLPAAQALYLPLLGASGTVGVLGLRPADRAAFDSPTVVELLETFAGQAALALERALLAEQSEREQLEVEAERLRTSLLSSLSHDLRTPLGVITGAASSMLEDGTLTEPVRRELLQTVIEEAQRMNRLIGNLLDMIRLESGALQAQKEPQPLEEPLGVALIRLEDRLRDHPVTVDFPADLPLVPMDGVLLEQVFVNLLENGIKHTPAGTPIEVRATVRDAAVQVDVEDRGPGIPSGEEALVFGKFYRSGGAQTGGGSGLGLTICRGIVLAHGGRIWADNRAGGGAGFHFTLPLDGVPSEAQSE